jgi:hypothetical protein
MVTTAVALVAQGIKRRFPDWSQGTWWPGLKSRRNNGVTATYDNTDVPGETPENPY